MKSLQPTNKSLAVLQRHPQGLVAPLPYYITYRSEYIIRINIHGIKTIF